MREEGPYAGVRQPWGRHAVLLLRLPVGLRHLGCARVDEVALSVGEGHQANHILLHRVGHNDWRSLDRPGDAPLGVLVVRAGPVVLLDFLPYGRLRCDGALGVNLQAENARQQVLALLGEGLLLAGGILLLRDGRLAALFWCAHAKRFQLPVRELKQTEIVLLWKVPYFHEGRGVGGTNLEYVGGGWLPHGREVDTRCVANLVALHLLLLVGEGPYKRVHREVYRGALGWGNTGRGIAQLGGREGVFGGGLGLAGARGEVLAVNVLHFATVYKNGIDARSLVHPQTTRADTGRE
ncbi:hypothetical protein AGDE_13899 [Angomonas deanei]|nr:hypothetical protein AGDE_13899 [Angomonas deanei]|eukprot:EPY21623.1 hypothetical protein AGDE_13899 [Angomonas deanei]